MVHQLHSAAGALYYCRPQAANSHSSLRASTLPSNERGGLPEGKFVYPPNSLRQNPLERSASNSSSSFATLSLSVDSASAVNSRRVRREAASAARSSRRVVSSRITSATSPSPFSRAEDDPLCGRNFPSVSLRIRNSSKEAIETRRRLFMPSCSTLPSSSPSCIYVRMVRGVTPIASAATFVVTQPSSTELPP